VGTLVDPLSEGGATASPTPSGKGAKGAEGATGAAASSSDGPSPWRLLEGAAGTVAVLAGGAFALRRRRAAVAAAKSQEGDGS
jgi:D-alanyl-D-alanine carboxypeptidase (penicillin-binding protein 5/6)